MSSPVIRLARPADCVEIFEVHRNSVRELCAQSYTQQQIDTWLDGRTAKMYLPAIGGGELWVAVLDRFVLGFVEVRDSEITKLFVSGAAAGRGVGRSLMDQAISHMRENGRTPICVESTTTARDFYARLGFIEIGRGSFSHGRSAVSLEIVKMELSL